MKPVTFAQFIMQRMNGVPYSRFDDEAKRAMVDFMRSDIPLSVEDRKLFAGDLENYYFPPSPHQKRARRRQAKARFLKSLIKHVAAANKDSKIPKPVAKAEKFFATQLGLTVGTMKKRIQRAKLVPSK
jgi:hypothetical protein